MAFGQHSVDHRALPWTQLGHAEHLPHDFRDPGTASSRGHRLLSGWADRGSASIGTAETAFCVPAQGGSASYLLERLAGGKVRGGGHTMSSVLWRDYGEVRQVCS